MQPDALTVYIVEDDAAVRDSLALMLGISGYRTVLFADAEAFLDAWRQDWAGCVIADLKLPGASGLELQSEARQRGSRLPFIIITAHGDVPAARAAFRADAVDFLEKPFEAQALLDRVREALAASQRARQSAAERAEVATRFARLTPRQRAVLDGLTQGKPSKIIAADLGVSPRTVDVHRFRLMQSLGASSLPDLFRLVVLVGNDTGAAGALRGGEEKREDSR